MELRLLMMHRDPLVVIAVKMREDADDADNNIYIYFVQCGGSEPLQMGLQPVWFLKKSRFMIGS